MSTKKITKNKTATIKKTTIVDQNTDDNTETHKKIKGRPRKEGSVTKFVPRLLCFSNIDAGKVCPYLFLQHILSQSFPSDIHYIINIFIETKNDETKYKKLLKPFFNPSKLRINFFLKTIVNSKNHLVGFTNQDYKNYNAFLYLDEYGIYLPNYIQNIFDKYDPNIDIATIKFPDTKDHNLSYNYILNNKTLDILIKTKEHNTDTNWLSAINEHHLISRELKDDTNSILYNIYQTDSIPQVAVADDSKYKVIENDFFTLCVFDHHFWSSFVYLNKRNHRMYNITNDDHGAFEIPDDKTIKIVWDTWGEEIFHKKYIDKTTYYYSINP